MTQKNTNHLPPEQASNLPIKIDTEYVWVNLLDAFGVRVMDRSIVEKQYILAPAPTLEELLALLPKYIIENNGIDYSLIIEYRNKKEGYRVKFEAYDKLILKTTDNKDPKQAVDMMLHWLDENDYLKELTNTK